jgi:hypothetical protein
MSHAKFPTQEGTISSCTAAPHLPMPRPESTPTAHLATEVADMEAPSTPNVPARRGETIEDMIKRLPPHGKQDCVTHARKDKTIDKLVKRIPTSKGLYKLFWMLTQKAKNAELGTGHQAMINKKACTAVDKAMHLLAMELNLVKHMLEHVVSHSVAKRRVIVIIQSEVVIEGLQKISEHEDANYAKRKQCLATSKTKHSDPPPSPQAKGTKTKDKLGNDSGKQKGKVLDASAASSDEAFWKMTASCSKRLSGNRSKKCKARQTSSVHYNGSSSRISNCSNLITPKTVATKVTGSTSGPEIWYRALLPQHRTTSFILCGHGNTCR